MTYSFDTIIPTRDVTEWLPNAGLHDGATGERAEGPLDKGVESGPEPQRPSVNQYSEEDLAEARAAGQEETRMQLESSLGQRIEELEQALKVERKRSSDRLREARQWIGEVEEGLSAQLQSLLETGVEDVLASLFDDPPDTFRELLRDRLRDQITWAGESGALCIRVHPMHSEEVAELLGENSARLMPDESIGEYGYRAEWKDRIVDGSIERLIARVQETAGDAIREG